MFWGCDCFQCLVGIGQVFVVGKYLVGCIGLVKGCIGVWVVVVEDQWCIVYDFCICCFGQWCGGW